MKKMTSLTNFECSTNEDISARLEGLAQKASTPQEFIESCTPTLQRMGHLANFPGLVHFAAEMQHICLKMLKVECDVQLQKEEELKALANTEKQQRFVFLKENLKLKSELKEKEEKTVLLREEVQKLKAKIDQLEDKLVAASKVQTSASMAGLRVGPMKDSVESQLNCLTMMTSMWMLTRNPLLPKSRQ